MKLVVTCAAVLLVSIAVVWAIKRGGSSSPNTKPVHKESMNGKIQTLEDEKVTHHKIDVASMEQYGDCAQMLYCEKLLGLQTKCNFPECDEQESSTGCLLYNVALKQWFIGFKCPIHGRGETWTKEWQPLIDEVLKIKANEGFDIDSALKALEERERKRKLGPGVN